MSGLPNAGSSRIALRRVCRLGVWLVKPQAMGDGRRFDTRTRAELGQDVADVDARGLAADVERVRYLLVGAALGNESDYLRLARRKASRDRPGPILGDV